MPGKVVGVVEPQWSLATRRDGQLRLRFAGHCERAVSYGVRVAHRRALHHPQCLRPPRRSGGPRPIARKKEILGPAKHWRYWTRTTRGFARKSASLEEGRRRMRRRARCGTGGAPSRRAGSGSGCCDQCLAKSSGPDQSRHCGDHPVVGAIGQWGGAQSCAVPPIHWSGRTRQIHGSGLAADLPARVSSRSTSGQNVAVLPQTLAERQLEAPRVLVATGGEFQNADWGTEPNVNQARF